MSGSINEVTLMGRLTRDPELRELPTGVKVAEFGLAMSEQYMNRDNQKVETICFVDVVAWEKTAENLARYKRKGAQILVQGQLQLDRWLNKNGEKRNKLKVRAKRIHFVGGNPESKPGDSVQPGNPEPGSLRQTRDPDMEDKSSIM